MNELTVTHEFNLVSNMDEVRASIAETIAKYDVVVVEDRLGEAKELMATFNKDKKEFSATCKKFIDTISEPITQFKVSQKEIETMYDNGRAKIADQVTKFEATKLDEIKHLILSYNFDECIARGINKDSVSLLDLVMLSAVSTNKTGYALTKKTTDAIDQRIQAIENEILKARLEAEEKAKRDREIADKARIEAEEKARQREVELLARAEREKQEALISAQREQAEAVERALQKQASNVGISMQEANQAVEQLREIQIEPKAGFLLDDCVVEVERDDGKKVFTIIATFEILAPSQIQHERITSKLKAMIESSGITSLKSIEVV